MNEWVRIYNQGTSLRQMAKIFHRADETISKVLRENNIEIRKFQKGKINKKLLILKYSKERKSTYTISKEVGRSQSTILYWLIKYQIKRRWCRDYPSPTKGKKRPDLTKRNKLNSGEKHPYWNKKRPKHSEKIKGKNHPNWKGGISKRVDKLRHKYWSELKDWRKKVFERDNYTCQKCKKRGGDIEAHHKKSINKYPELIIQIENGQTLCKECHQKETINAIKNGWKEQNNQ